MRSELNGDNFGCITFKENLVGGPPWFGDIEISPNGFGNISELLFMFSCFHIIDFQYVLIFHDYYIKCHVNETSDMHM